MRWDCEQRWWRCSGIEKASWSVAADRSGIGSVREAREKSVVDADGGHYLQQLLLVTAKAYRGVFERPH
jgi:hypothetical protein